MIQRFKDKYFNDRYNFWVNIPRSDVHQLINVVSAGSNRDTAFIRGYKSISNGKPCIYQRNWPLYPIWVAGREWRKVNNICPDCGKKLHERGEMKTDWYGWLAYYRCHNCETTFISRSGEELEIAAP